MKARLSQFLVYCLWFLNIHLLSENEVVAAQTEVATADKQDEKSRAPINLQSLSFEEKKKFKDSFDIIFTDCDGVLYNHSGAINNAHETVRELIKEGKTIRFVTNSSRKTMAMVLERLRNLGFDSANEESVICPMALIADYLRDKLPPSKSVYVIGSEVVCEEIRRHNIHCFGPGKDEMSDEMTKDIPKVNLKLPNDVGAVIVGFDVHIDYDLKIPKAFRFLRNEECLYIVLNPDEMGGLSSNERFPAGGALAASISLATGREPFVLGKPHLIEILKSKVNDPQRALFIGDRLNTDIITGNKCTFRTLLVLSGVHNLGVLKKYAESNDPEDRMYIPDFYTNYFSELVFK